MDRAELCYLPATELVSRYRARELSPVEVVDAVLERIERLDPTLNAFCTLTAESARADAKEAERRLQVGEPVGPLVGVPISIKDLVNTKGVRTTRGSLTFAESVPTEDAPVVERLRQAGAVILGKTNTPEFGWKAATDNRVFGATRNPWNLDRTPGGSSGGAGAAVAAGMGPLAVGTDGGGSIRIPSSFCGLFGLKPTLGLIPVHPASWAQVLSHAGPMTRTVRDAALMLNAIAGHDERDANSAPIPPVDYREGIALGLHGLRVAWSPDLGQAGKVNPEVRSAAERAARRFEELGCRVEEASPDLTGVAPAWLTLFYASISAGIVTLAAGWEEKLDPGLAKIVADAQSITGVELAQAYHTRARVFDNVQRFFRRYDLLLTPSFAVSPWPLGIDFPDEIGGQKVGPEEIVHLTLPFNMTGHPAATVPCGWTADRLPLGLQIVGRRYDEALVLRAAAAFEAMAPWVAARPEIG